MITKKTNTIIILTFLLLILTACAKTPTINLDNVDYTFYQIRMENSQIQGDIIELKEYKDNQINAITINNVLNQTYHSKITEDNICIDYNCSKIPINPKNELTMQSLFIGKYLGIEQEEFTGYFIQENKIARQSTFGKIHCYYITAKENYNDIIDPLLDISMDGNICYTKDLIYNASLTTNIQFESEGYKINNSITRHITLLGYNDKEYKPNIGICAYEHCIEKVQEVFG